MRHNLAIAVLIIGMASSVVGQERPVSLGCRGSAASFTDDNQQKTPAQMKRKDGGQSKAKEQKRARSYRKDTKQSDSRGPAVQNTVEYGG